MPTNKQQRESARRHLERQLERRRERDAARRRNTMIASIVGTVVVIGVAVGFILANTGGSKKPAAKASNTPSASATSTPSAAQPVVTTNGPCGYKQATAAEVAQGLKNVGMPPDPRPTPKTDRVMTFTTNRGVIEVKMDGVGAPCNVQSISFLAGKKFYDNTSCPRVVNSGIFVVQCGSPSNSTSGGPSYTTKDENLTKASYTPGVLAMANSGPDTNGSQFFFITKDSSKSLSKNYTVIGHVTKGLDILQKVATGGNDGSNQAGGGKPKLSLTFKTVRVSPAVTGSGTVVTTTPTATTSTSPVG